LPLERVAGGGKNPIDARRLLVVRAGKTRGGPRARGAVSKIKAGPTGAFLKHYTLSVAHGRMTSGRTQLQLSVFTGFFFVAVWDGRAGRGWNGRFRGRSKIPARVAKRRPPVPKRHQAGGATCRRKKKPFQKNHVEKNHPIRFVAALSRKRKAFLRGKPLRRSCKNFDPLLEKVK